MGQGRVDFKLSRKQGAKWAAGQRDSRLHGQEVVASLCRALIRPCLKHCVQRGQ